MSDRSQPPWSVQLALARREARFGLGLVLPTAAVVLLVVLFPFAWTILLALQQIRLIDVPNLSVFGADYTLENFAFVFADPLFWESVGITLAYSVLGTVGSIGLGLVAALALRKKFRGRTIVRAVLLTPYVVPVVAAAASWQALLNPQYGLVNAIGTGVLGWDRPISFLTTETYRVEFAGLHLGVPLALLVVVAFEVWRSFPLAFLFFTARLQAVPAELEEAAFVDGAGGFQRFRHVLLPQLAGVLVLLVFLRFIWIFQNFNDVYLLNGGAGGTNVLALEVFNNLVVRNDIGTASAVGLAMAAFLTLCMVGYLRVSSRGRS